MLADTVPHSPIWSVEKSCQLPLKVREYLRKKKVIFDHMNLKSFNLHFLMLLCLSSTHVQMVG